MQHILHFGLDSDAPDLEWNGVRAVTGQGVKGRRGTHVMPSGSLTHQEKRLEFGRGWLFDHFETLHRRPIGPDGHIVQPSKIALLQHLHMVRMGRTEGRTLVN